MKANTTFYAILSIVCFLLGAALLLVMIWKPETLAAFGLTDKLFYVVLIPVALSAAGFLFGVLRSYAHYQGKTLNGTLELGGPVVAAALVVVGGLQLPSAPATFPFTVYVHGDAGPQDLILKDQGDVTIQLGLEPRTQPIRGNGQAYFPAIPGQFRGAEVNVFVTAPGFENAEGGRVRILGDSISLGVRKSAAKLAGYILDADGNPVERAKVEVAGLSTLTNADGRFELMVPGKLVTDELMMTARATGYEIFHDTVVPRSNEVRVSLKRSRK